MTDSVERGAAAKQQPSSPPAHLGKDPAKVGRRTVTKAVLGLPAVMTLHAGTALAQSSAVNCVIKGNFDPQGNPGGPFVDANPLSATYTNDPPNVRVAPDTDPPNSAWVRRPVTVAQYNVDNDSNPGTDPVQEFLYTEDPFGDGGPFYRIADGSRVPDGQVLSRLTDPPGTGEALFYIEVDQNGNLVSQGLENDGVANPVSLSCYNSFTTV